VKKILIIEDDRIFSKIVESFLLKNSFEVKVCADLKSSKDFLKQESVDLILLDFRLPDGTGLDFISFAKNNLQATPIVIITSFNDVRTAVKTLRSGAYEYIVKPVNPEELLMVIQSAFQDKERIEQPESVLISIDNYILGNSKQAKKLYEHVELVSPTEMSVMILGESGTGKEHVARRIHDLSSRKDKKFIAVDCGVLSKELAGSELFGHEKGAFTGASQAKTGLFQEADGGTLFLDEIGNLNYEVQMKLLRSIQEKEIIPIGGVSPISIDIRLITATNENLHEKIASGEFREDLYHRINEFKIQMPPLRERHEDLELFTQFFIQKANKELNKNVLRFSHEVMEFFSMYDWPGNLRELKNLVKRMVLLSKSEIGHLEQLPEEMKNFLVNKQETLILHSEDDEKLKIIQALEKAKYNKSKAAKLLQIDRKTLYNKLDKYNISH
jgi:two-component system response regulator HydG